MFENVSITLLMVLGPALMAVLTWVAYKLKSYLQTKTMNEYVKGVLSRLTDSALEAVKGVYQVYVKPLKLDGKLSEEAKKAAKSEAVAYLKSFMGPKGLGELSDILGVNGDELESALEHKVEAALSEAKADPKNNVK